jgi:hypothetical protein
MILLWKEEFTKHFIDLPDEGKFVPLEYLSRKVTLPEEAKKQHCRSFLKPVIEAPNKRTELDFEPKAEQ